MEKLDNTKFKGKVIKTLKGPYFSMKLHETGWITSGCVCIPLKIFDRRFDLIVDRYKEYTDKDRIKVRTMIDKMVKYYKTYKK